MLNLNLKINNVRSINKADINISKINVVGGVNSSGKTTVSKLLYCFLKSQIDDESLDYLMDSEDLSDLKDSEISFNLFSKSTLRFAPSFNLALLRLFKASFILLYSS